MDIVPIIDVSSLVSGESSESESVKKTVSEISQACREIGFFYVKNHGVPLDLIQKVFEEAEIFFNQNIESKLKYIYHNMEGRGYISIGEEKVNSKTNENEFKEGTHSDYNQGDYKEGYDLPVPWKEQESYDVLKRSTS